jgi:pimeloyl-ACP methyl ester carboxylesterase
MKIAKMVVIVVAMFFFTAYGAGALADICTDLALQPYGGATITSATMVPASGGTPTYCRVTATAGEQTDIEVWLPDNWQKRFLHLGGGGFDGVTPFDPAAAPPPVYPLGYYDKLLQQGYALAGSNGGHRATKYPGPTFALDYTLAQDYAYTAIGTTVRVAKALIDAYYGERPKYSYFLGCSNGGRGAFNAAAKYPNWYDGVVATSPSRNMPGLSAAWMEFMPAMALTPGKIATLFNATVVECDGLDGLKDGIISNPDACTFDPASLRCKGASNDSCLTEQEIAIVKKIQSDLKLSDGTLIYSRTGFGELNWAWGYGVLGPGFVNWLTFRNPSYSSWNLNHDFPAVVEVLEGAYACSGETESLAKYLNWGKKMIVWHGSDDTLLSHYDTIRTFNDVMSAAGGHGRKNAQLYVAQGVSHCGGGPGADTVDLVSAITDWVEKGQAPETLLASKINPQTGGVLFTRPLCEYPKFPYYIGGNPNDAASFSCKNPGHAHGNYHRNDE